MENEKDFADEPESLGILGSILSIVAQSIPFWMKKWGYDEKAILKFIRDVENHTATAFQRNNETVKDARKRLIKKRAELLLEQRRESQ